MYFLYRSLNKRQLGLRLLAIHSVLLTQTQMTNLTCFHSAVFVEWGFSWKIIEASVWRSSFRPCFHVSEPFCFQLLCLNPSHFLSHGHVRKNLLFLVALRNPANILDSRARLSHLTFEKCLICFPRWCSFIPWRFLHPVKDSSHRFYSPTST